MHISQDTITTLQHKHKGSIIEDDSESIQVNEGKDCDKARVLIARQEFNRSHKNKVDIK